MAIKFQYNKTALQELNRQLKIRQRALPTLKNKESALRVEVKKAKDAATAREEDLERRMADYERMVRLWKEFDPGLVAVEEVQLKNRKIAGIKVPVLENIVFQAKSYSLFNRPHWYADGIAILKELAQIAIEKQFYLRMMELLDRARKKTTQKVNLYEKVQIPGYEEAILKIKRFLEDEENLSKAAQKIVKKRQAAASAEKTD
ncbi:MAG: V-type ATP synthase subunit D [Phaeodactylibacter sp.]|nr:V-type ATP synthase subunit D [Phaeodactylibacter sp.]MCB9304436.1 V-type ATP synthase subunit D [Lewinellaceae bacterium]HQU57933.1 V-type ATP synthase subunit D [Saprospiraceae bacterium]